MQKDLLDQQLEANLHGDFLEGWRIAQILERERPGDNRAAFNRGWHVLAQGDLQKGMTLLDRGRLEGVFGSPPLQRAEPVWDGVVSLFGKRVLLRGEGGYGDEILNARFATALAQRGAYVILACSPELASLLSRISGVSEVVSRDVPEECAFDFWVPAMSAARILGYTYETLPHEPYLSPLQEKMLEHRHRVTTEGYTVGIRWSGNPRFEHEQHRRFPTEPIFALCTIPGVTLYSLQRDADLRDLPEGIVDLEKAMVSWEDTAALIAHLDLVITSCTAIAHLAAAMGKETWIIVPILPYYIWAPPGNQSVWYPSVRLFRQEVFGEWDVPLARVQIALQKRLGIESPDPLRVRKDEHVDNPPLVAEFQTMHRTANQTALHFIAGLPRSGSTALVSLLSQNPRILGAPISGLCGMFMGVYANWDKDLFHQEQPNESAKCRVLRALLDVYHGTERPLILDKNRGWVASIGLLEAILEREVKIILPVRPLVEILASFEILRREHPTDLTNADEALGPGSSIMSRADYFMSPGGIIGLPYNQMKDAVTSGYLDRLLFVDYNKLMAAPKAQVRRVYEFLEEPYFEHDFERVVRPGASDSRVHKFTGLHDVRAQFVKVERNPRFLLGTDVYQKYDMPEPWTQWT